MIFWDENFTWFKFIILKFEHDRETCQRPWFTQIKNSLTFFVITSQNIILEEMKRAIEKPAPPFKTDTIEKVASKVFQKFIVYKQIGKDNSSQKTKNTRLKCSLPCIFSSGEKDYCLGIWFQKKSWHHLEIIKWI